MHGKDGSNACETTGEAQAMTATTFALNGLMTGKTIPLGPRCVPSGIAKTQVHAKVRLTRTGFIGDEQGDTVRHGGPEKAVHHYPFDHYSTWAKELDGHEVLARPGAFGENISTIGLTEGDVAVGDVFQLGTATIEISQGRQPCWKLNQRFTRADMAKSVQSTGRTGWYYRVLIEGDVGPDDHLTLIDRQSPSWTIERIWRLFYVDPLNRHELEAVVELPALAENWRTHAARRLKTNKVEDWTLRLTGSEPLPPPGKDDR